jgi:AraC-like DNA-binding protein
MARARQLLITTTAPISEIAAAVGYTDSFYFSRQFSAVNQVSPRRFRQGIDERTDDRPAQQGTPPEPHLATQEPYDHPASRGATPVQPGL